MNGKAAQTSTWQKFFITGAAIVLLDQLTKDGAASLAQPITLTSFFALRFSTNTGAAFSTFTQYPILLTLIAAAAVIGIPFLLRKVKPAEILLLGFIWGGALGNLLDRLLLGSVRDFIAFSFWPSFNVADAAITIGVVWLLWMEWGKKA